MQTSSATPDLLLIQQNLFCWISNRSRVTEVVCAVTVVSMNITKTDNIWHFSSTGLYTTDRYASKAVRVSVYCATYTKRKPDVLCTQGHRQHIMLVFTFSKISINNNMLAYKAPVCQKTSEAPKHPESSFLNCCTGSKIPTHHSNYEISSLA